MSVAGLGLLNALLTYDPAKRATARAALRHAYFREQPAPREPGDMPTFPSAHEVPDAHPGWRSRRSAPCSAHACGGRCMLLASGEDSCSSGCKHSSLVYSLPSRLGCSGNMPTFSSAHTTRPTRTPAGAAAGPRRVPRARGVSGCCWPENACKTGRCCSGCKHSSQQEPSSFHGRLQQLACMTCSLSGIRRRGQGRGIACRMQQELL